MHNTKLKQIIAAYVMRFHEAVIGIIWNEPSGIYNNPTHNTLHQKIIFVISEKLIIIKNLHKWKNEVIEGFEDKSWLGVNISKFGRGSSKMYVDSRCLVRERYEQG